MEKHLIDFKQIEWVNPAEGIRFKAYEKDGKTIRLMELSGSYSDSDWCRHGHIGQLRSGNGL